MAIHSLQPELWIDRYADYLFNYTIVRVNDTVVAEDLISETFLAGLKSRKNFKGEASERTWLIAILKRKIIDYYGKKNSIKGQAEVRMQFTDGGLEGDWLEDRVADADNQNAEEALENKELGLAILNCMGGLSDRHAAIFRQKSIENQDTEAICNEYNITPSNLWVIIHRARKSLADCLQQNWF
ncbi:MAG: RNA polymerase subunit sigma-70 [Flavobacteriaceae bacterium]|nr:RNA polymerase subunit sigma-70 [Flavobacteriaceae bacterium]